MKYGRWILWSFFYHHSELCRTRRCVPDRGFLTTIQNIIEVAKLSAYLGKKSGTEHFMNGMRNNIPGEDVLSMVVPEGNCWGSSDWNSLWFSVIRHEEIRVFTMVLDTQVELIRMPHCTHS